MRTFWLVTLVTLLRLASSPPAAVAQAAVTGPLAARISARIAQVPGAEVAVSYLDLQSGDVASYLDVQFRRSVADLAGITDINPRVLQDAVFTHDTGIGLLLAPAEG